MEPRLKLLDSGGLVGVIRKDLNSPLAVPEKPCAGETRLRFSTAAPDALCFIRPRRRSGRPPGTLRVPRVPLSLYAKQDAVHADGVLIGRGRRT